MGQGRESMLRWVGAAALAAAFGATNALAGDKPVIAPPAAWVHPADPVQPPPKPDDAATHMLLLDQQVHFGAEGQAIYTEAAVRVQNAQGLTAMGNIALPWNPDLGGLIVHKVQIIRDGKTIDMLAKQSFTVLRREKDLEAASLNGVLTAVLQPEDLRVGDVVDLAFTISRKDPALAGHAQAILQVVNVPVESLRLRASTDAKANFRWRSNEAVQGERARSGQVSELFFNFKDVKPTRPPEDAPMRFQHGRQFEVSDFKSWAEVSALFDPLFAKAAILAPNSPLQAEVARIKGASSDPKLRAQAALELVQEQVRYLALNMNEGGLVPADADTTWTRRFGDCKGKTALLIALLHALDIEAQPVLVSTVFGDGLDERLPMEGLFDHVLVRATIAGRTYWLDGTRIGDHALDQIETPAFGWGLPVQPANATLVQMIPAPLERPAAATILRLDASEGLDLAAKAHAETTLRGDAAVILNAQLSAPGVDQQAGLRAFWKGAYDFIEPSSVSAHFDSQAREERLLMDGTATLAWDRVQDTRARHYQADGSGLGWKEAFKREPGPHADAPFAVSFPSFEQMDETIVLPNGGEGFTVEGEDVDRQVAGRAFLRKSKIADGVFTLHASTRGLAPEFPAADAPAAAKALTDMANVTVYVRASADYKMTKPEIDALLKSTPTTVDEARDRGLVQMHSGHYKEAVADFDKAATLDPKSAIAVADRGIARMWSGDEAGAEADFKAARAIDPAEPVIDQGEGDLEVRRSDYAAAIASFTRAIERDPSDDYSRMQRVAAYRHIRDNDGAIQGLAELLRREPSRRDLRALRVKLLLAAGRRDEAVTDGDAAVAAEPNQAEAHTLRAETLAAAGRKAEAQAEFERSIALKPTEEAYTTRLLYRDAHDYAGQLADIEAAIKLSPDFTLLYFQRAEIEGQAGVFDKALAHINAQVAASPYIAAPRRYRAAIYAHAHQLDLAAADFAWVRGRAKTAQDWNALCWTQATAGVFLDQALADCEAGLKLDPKAANIQDSRAFVLAKLGRLDDSIAAYDEVLTVNPREYNSLYGRGVVEIRKGDAGKGRADLDAARAISATVDNNFVVYGLTP